jgi:threonylcarbamoyladenosine tRNA methylthiotransferase MtaB
VKVEQITPDRIEFVMHTWGCKVNTYDTGLLQSRLPVNSRFNEQSPGQNYDLSEPARELDSNKVHHRVHILNTCAVTAEASKEAVRRVRNLKAREPQSTVVVTGCAAQVDGGLFDSLKDADLVVANSHKGEIEKLVKDHLEGRNEKKVFRSNIFRKSELEEGGGLEADHTRAFLKVQDGCNSFCSYCVIPFARGKSRSIPIESLVRRVNDLHILGASEIVITGVHIADYEDISSGVARGLEDLVETLLRQTKIPRIRISSLEPIELSERLLDLYGDSRLCPHFHLSIQSACTTTLQRMKRRYTGVDVENVFSRIAKKLPRAFVGMDLIVGFPGETHEEFQETYDCLKRNYWTRIHVFPYSERPGTKAVQLNDSVPNHVRQSRAAFVRQLSSSRYREQALLALGETRLGLILKSVKNSGRVGTQVQAITRDYWTVRLNGSGLQAGFEVPIQLERYVEPSSGRLDGWIEGRLVT